MADAPVHGGSHATRFWHHRRNTGRVRTMLIDVAFAAALAAAAPAGDAPLYTTPYFQSLGVAAGLPSSRIYKTSCRTATATCGSARTTGWPATTASVFASTATIRRTPTRSAATSSARCSSTAIIASGAAPKNPASACSTRRAGNSRTMRMTSATRRASAATTSGRSREDASGAIWAGGYAAGIDRLVPGATGFAHYRHDAADQNSIASDTVLGLMAARDGRLWVGSESGIDVIDVGGSLRHADLSVLPDSRRINANSIARRRRRDGTGRYAAWPAAHRCSAARQRRRRRPPERPHRQQRGRRQ